MQPLSFDRSAMAAYVLEELQALVATSESLSDFDLLDAARCRGWSRLDTVVHVRSGIAEMVVGCLSVTTAEPDHDAATYWSSHPDDRDEDPVAHVLWLRRTASAYGRPSAAVRHLAAVAASVPPVLGAMGEHHICFQGKVLTGGDYLATWVVELAVHHLDLAVPTAHPTSASLGVARTVIEAIAGHALPAEMPDEEAVLVGIGRQPWPPGHEAIPSFPVSL